MFTSDFSANNLNDCCDGKAIDPALITNNENYNLSPEYNIALEKLNKLITANKRKIEVIEKKWQNGQKESIVISITPVTGAFCSSNYHWDGQKKYGYKGKVYIPFSSFGYDSGFWDTPAYKKITTQDFADVNYSIIPY